MQLQKRFISLLIVFGFFMLILAGIFVYIKRDSLRKHFSVVKDELTIVENKDVSGIYYKENPAAFDTLQNFVHLKLKVNNSHSFRVNKSLWEQIPDSTNILLSVEFWGHKYLRKIKNHPLAKINEGAYDKKLQKIYETLFSGDRNIFVRINPEMDLPLYQNPWQYSEDYIESYRHVVSKWQGKNSKVKFVWGPSGFWGAEEFYPGDDVVDYMSITIKNETEWLFKRYPPVMDTKNEIHRKMHRLRFFDKPVMVLANKKWDSRQLVSSCVMSEIDSVAKYRNIAYNDSLWSSAEPITSNSRFLIGVHDPDQHLVLDAAISVEHIFIDFSQIQTGELKRLLNEAFSRNHDVIVTMEPTRAIGVKADTNVLISTIQGKYDTIYQRLFQEITNQEHIVYLRFAHEMEIPVERYDWQLKDPIDYIRAFRYFMQLPKPFPLNVKKVWGPAGDWGSADFYPGDDVVDYASFAAYGLPDKNITDFKRQVTFGKLSKRKLWRLRLINKPIFITEFGIKGPEEFQSLWLEDAAKVINENSKIIGASYFNRSDIPGAWGDIDAPDWGITINSFHRFVDVLERNCD